MAKFKTFTELTKANKEELKKDYPNLKLIGIPLENEDLDEASFILIPPTRNILNAVSKNAVEKDIEKVNKILINNCIIAGDMKYIAEEYKDQSIYLTVLGEIGKLQKVKEVIVKKL